MISGLLTDLYCAASINLPFALAWQRARCIRRGHVFDGSEVIDRLRSEKHPHNDHDFVYAVIIRKCTCGLMFTDQGMELRNGAFGQDRKLQ